MCWGSKSKITRQGLIKQKHMRVPPIISLSTLLTYPIYVTPAWNATYDDARRGVRTAKILQVITHGIRLSVRHMGGDLCKDLHHEIWSLRIANVTIHQLAAHSQGVIRWGCFRSPGWRRRRQCVARLNCLERQIKRHPVRHTDRNNTAPRCKFSKMRLAL